MRVLLTVMETTFLSITIVLIILIAVFTYLFFVNDKKQKKVFEIAFYDSKYHIANLNMLIRQMSNMIGKNEILPQSSIISFIVSGYQNKIVNVFGLEAGEESYRRISKLLTQKYKVTFYLVAYSEVNNSFYAVVNTQDSTIINDYIVAFTKDINDELYEYGLDISIVLKSGVYAIKPVDYDAQAIVDKADMCRRLIENDNSNILFFSDEVSRVASRETDIRNAVIKGIDNKEFEVYYQPKFDINTRRFTGAEALIRWNHPTLGLVSPGYFIEIIESTPIIVDLDRYVFEHVLMDISAWRKAGKRLVPVSINISRVEVYRSDLIDFIDSKIKQYNINPMLIEMELTETSASKDILFVSSVIKRLKLLNVKVDLDDFGTGYSSLSSLRNLAIDVIKLDRSFFNEIEINAKAREIVKNTINLAKALELYIVAEGIQTTKQVEFLRKTGCDAIQGFYYSKALPADEFIKFLSHNKFE